MVAAAPPPVVVHGPQHRWFAPGALAAGARVRCRSHGRTIVLTVPARKTGVLRAADGLGGGIQASVEVRPNGAVEIDCDLTGAPPVRATLPYVIGRNGLALLRGTNTLARLRAEYGPGTTMRTRPCRVRWRTIGLSATFGSCAPNAQLAAATVTSRRWTTLNGVRIGDSVARLLWQDQGAARITERTWALGGRSARPRLLARLDRAGRVAEFVVER
ncbi:MAG TPA: hypothetical protein VGK79_03935 [Gaiellaceae bacterium]